MASKKLKDEVRDNFTLKRLKLEYLRGWLRIEKIYSPLWIFLSSEVKDYWVYPRKKAKSCKFQIGTVLPDRVNVAFLAPTPSIVRFDIYYCYVEWTGSKLVTEKTYRGQLILAFFKLAS